MILIGMHHEYLKINHKNNLVLHFSNIFLGYKQFYIDNVSKLQLQSPFLLYKCKITILFSLYVVLDLKM